MHNLLSYYQFEPSCSLRVVGEDAAAFLNSQFSGDLRTVEAGLCCYGLWLDAKGKVIADGWVRCLGTETFEIISLETEVAVLKEKLERHIIADDVQLEVHPSGVMFFIQGEGVEKIVAAIFGTVPIEGKFIEAGGGICYRGRRAGEQHYDCWFPDLAAAKALMEALNSNAARAVSNEWVQLARIAAGYPAVPRELGARDLPGEAGQVGEAVCTTKGCFLGQESVLRLHNLGQARRRLHAVTGKGAVPTVPQSVVVEGEERVAGELRSAYASDAGWTGVAMLKLSCLETALSCSKKPVEVGHAMGSRP